MKKRQQSTITILLIINLVAQGNACMQVDYEQLIKYIAHQRQKQSIGISASKIDSPKKQYVIKTRCVKLLNIIEQGSCKETIEKISTLFTNHKGVI